MFKWKIKGNKVTSTWAVGSWIGTVYSVVIKINEIGL